MLKSLLILAALAVVVFAQTETVTAAVGYAPGEVRAYSATAEPNWTTPYGLALVGAGANWNASGAVLDVLGFAFRNPSDPAQSSPALAFYLGQFAAVAAWNPTTGITASAGAGAELAAEFSAITGYWDRDGNPGFDWVLGNNLFCNNGLPASTTDCLEILTYIDLTKQSWTPIAITNQSCPAGYQSSCRVFWFTTSTTTGTFTITLKLASEPVNINGIPIDQFKGKLDITINFPWENYANVSNYQQLKLALTGAYAGKAGAYAAARSATVNGHAGYVFTGGLVSSYFSWDGTAQIGGQSSTIYATGLSGTTILNYNCATMKCDLVSAAVLIIYKAAVTVWQAFGWSVELVVFSSSAAQTATVVWDPEIGVSQQNDQINYQTGSTTSIAVRTVASPASTVLLAVAIAAAVAFAK